jgi:hypothetical protein
MTVQQSADVTMFRHLSVFLTQNASIIDKSPTLKEDAMDFQNALTQLEATLKTLDTVSEITGQEKLLLRDTITQYALKYLSIIQRHAIKTNHATLKKKTDIKVSALKQSSDADFIAKCNQVSEVLTENAPILAAALIPAAEQNRLIEQMNHFKAVKPQVKLNITRKAIHKEDMDSAIKNMKAHLKQMLDASVLSVESTDANFVREYFLNRQRREPVKATAKAVVKKETIA